MTSEWADIENYEAEMLQLGMGRHKEVPRSRRAKSNYYSLRKFDHLTRWRLANYYSYEQINRVTPWSIQHPRVVENIPAQEVDLFSEYFGGNLVKTESSLPQNIFDVPRATMAQKETVIFEASRKETQKDMRDFMLGNKHEYRALNLPIHEILPLDVVVTLRTQFNENSHKAA